MGQGYADLSAVEITILDEADHMADLGFLPGVRRIMDKTPRQGQRMLFSATLDKAIDVLVKRFLTKPVTHEADSAQSPISTMRHHVLHVTRDQRVPVLVDLTSAPGRTVVFTRTKHGAKALARQLNKQRRPEVELHGNLSQNARTRNMEAFHSGTATTLVATDIAARGIHVDDVALVVHADPPVEHKAYLHRSGRTARAGAEGTVITLMTDEQVRDVRDLTRLAGIKPTTTKVNGPGHPMLSELAPGERSTPGGLVVDVPTSGGGGRSNGANAQRKRARSPARPTASRVGATRPVAHPAVRPARRPAPPVAASVVAPAAARVVARLVRAARVAASPAVAPAARVAARADSAVATAAAVAAATAPRRSRAAADPAGLETWAVAPPRAERCGGPFRAPGDTLDWVSLPSRGPPMPTRTARTAWNGTVMEGSGQVELTSSGVGTYDVSWPARVADAADGTTSPRS